MAKFTNPLANVRIASPCPANWDEMVGDERERFCGQCKLNVYNLSGMTTGEAENLLINAEGRLCVRFYRRADGTVLTKDCPVGWRAIKRKVSRTATAVFSFVVGFFGGVGFGTAFNQTESIPSIDLPPIINSTFNEVIADEAIVGQLVSVPPPEEATVGKLEMGGARADMFVGRIAPPQKLKHNRKK